MILLVTVGCGPSGPKLHPVRGSVHFEGRAAEGATVILEPTNSNVNTKPTGIVGADGTFTVRTYPHGEGAVEGEYMVLITWYPSKARESEDTQNKLPSRYSDPTRTPLPKITIKGGRNEIPPIKLTAK